jgi:ADP-ribosylglycohydrolase
MEMILDHALDILLGVAVGDALGVPVEFLSRESIQKNPVTGMTGYGTHMQSPGTWSDDSSLTFCLAEMLAEGYDLQRLADKFVWWYDQNYWTAHGEVFDVGIATSGAINQLKKGVSPVLAGGSSEYSNGNGSLMRILPLALYVRNMPIAEKFRVVSDVSSLTHAHIRSVLACFIYIEMALQLINGLDKMSAYNETVVQVNQFIHQHDVCSTEERDRFHRILVNPIGDFEIRPIYEHTIDEIASDGYVVSTLEAAFWCLMTTDSYEEAVLAAVNLGKDTDTTAAVTGGLAALLYGHKSIPEKWLAVLARHDDIVKLAVRLADGINKKRP